MSLFGAADSGSGTLQRPSGSSSSNAPSTNWPPYFSSNVTPRPVRNYTVNGQPAPLDAHGNPIGNTDDNFGPYTGPKGPPIGSVGNGAPTNSSMPQSPGAPQFSNTNFSGSPNFGGVANQQAGFNSQLAAQQNSMNNPDQVGPTGSRTMTMDPVTGKYTVNTAFNSDMQKAWNTRFNDNQWENTKEGILLGRPELNFDKLDPLQKYDPSGAPAMNKFSLSGVGAMPSASESDLNKTRDSVYGQNTQYLDPQFQQGQSDLEVKLANQGVMPGSAAYDREMNNFNLTKQKAYGDARNSAIQAGGAEQSRLFGLGLQGRQQGVNEALDTFNTGLQGHQQGVNDALAKFNTGLQARQQGVSEASTLFNTPINALNGLRSGGYQIQTPTFAGTTGTNISGVDLMGSAQAQYNAQLAQQNADAASHNNTMNGLYGLGGAAIQSGALNGAGSWLSGLFGGAA